MYSVFVCVCVCLSVRASVCSNGVCSLAFTKYVFSAYKGTTYSSIFMYPVCVCVSVCLSVRGWFLPSRGGGEGEAGAGALFTPREAGAMC